MSKGNEESFDDIDSFISALDKPRNQESQERFSKAREVRKKSAPGRDGKALLDNTIDVPIEIMNDVQIDSLIAALISEKITRAVSNYDPEALIVSALNSNFDRVGEPSPPLDMGGGLIAITGSVKDLSASRRKSVLFTIRLEEDDPGEWWAWDDSAPTYVGSETVKVGNYRKTASLHALHSGALLVQHTILWNNDERERKAVKGYIVEQKVEPTGEITSTKLVPGANSVLRKLPVPPGLVIE